MTTFKFRLFLLISFLYLTLYGWVPKSYVVFLPSPTRVGDNLKPLAPVMTAILSWVEESITPFHWGRLVVTATTVVADYSSTFYTWLSWFLQDEDRAVSVMAFCFSAILSTLIHVLWFPAAFFAFVTFPFRN